MKTLEEEQNQIRSIFLVIIASMMIALGAIVNTSAENSFFRDFLAGPALIVAAIILILMFGGYNYSNNSIGAKIVGMIWVFTAFVFFVGTVLMLIGVLDRVIFLERVVLPLCFLTPMSFIFIKREKEQL